MEAHLSRNKNDLVIQIFDFFLEFYNLENYIFSYLRDIVRIVICKLATRYQSIRSLNFYLAALMFKTINHKVQSQRGKKP